MIYTYKNIQNIEFPVYRLPSDDWHKVDGLVYLEAQILDDRNIKDPRLGVRRLKTPMRPLYPLKKGSLDIEFLLKHKHFIDSAGRLFTYEKTRYQTLKYLKIKSVERKETGSLVWFFDSSVPFEVPRPPPERAVYARVLYFNNNPWLIYDFAYENGKDTKRMV